MSSCPSRILFLGTSSGLTVHNGFLFHVGENIDGISHATGVLFVCLDIPGFPDSLGDLLIVAWAVIIAENAINRLRSSVNLRIRQPANNARLSVGTTGQLALYLLAGVALVAVRQTDCPRCHIVSHSFPVLPRSQVYT